MVFNTVECSKIAYLTVLMWIVNKHRCWKKQVSVYRSNVWIRSNKLKNFPALNL